MQICRRADNQWHAPLGIFSISWPPLWTHNYHSRRPLVHHISVQLQRFSRNDGRARSRCLSYNYPEMDPLRCACLPSECSISLGVYATAARNVFIKIACAFVGYITLTWLWGGRTTLVLFFHHPIAFTGSRLQSNGGLTPKLTRCSASAATHDRFWDMLCDILVAEAIHFP